MKQLTREEFIKEMTNGRQGVDVDMGVNGMHANEGFYRSENARLYGILIHDQVDDDWGFIVFYRMAEHGAINYDTGTSMEKEEALAKLTGMLDEMDRKPFGIVLGASVSELSGRHVAIIHGVTPLERLVYRMMGIIPDGCVVARIGPFSSEGKAKKAGSKWLDDYHRKHPDTSARSMPKADA